MSEIIRFAIVGFGSIGRRHAELICKNEAAELVAIIETATVVKSIMWSNTPQFSSLHDFFRSKIATDVVVIASPNGLHAEHALEALNYNSHILIEKPLALTVLDARRIKQKALDVGMKVFPVVQNRCSPASIWIKDLIKSGTLGEIFIVQVNCFWNRDRRYYSNDWRGSRDLDGGTLFTQFYHFIDMLYWLFGDIKNIHGKFADFNHKELTEFEDSGFVSFDFAEGGMGSINYSTSVWSKNLESSLTIIAENGSVKISGQYMDNIEHCVIKNYVMPELETGEANSSQNSSNHHQVVSKVIDILNGREAAMPTIEEGIKVIDIINRIYSQRNSEFYNSDMSRNMQAASLY